LRIEVNPAAVDVNVHPAKLEVKFSNERPVFEAIYYAVRNALESNVTRPSIDPTTLWNTNKRVSDMTEPIADKRGESLQKRQLSAELYSKAEPTPKPQEKTVPPTTQATPQKKAPAFEHITAEQYVKNYLMADTAKSAQIPQKPKETVKEAPVPENNTVKITPAPIAEPRPPQVEEIKIELPKENTTPEVKQEAPTETVESKSLEYRIVGEVFNSYVIVERGDTMLLIDKHAAHERIIFERLKESMRSNEPSSQLLLLPIEVMMTSEEIRLIDEYRKDFEAIGFDFTVGRYTVSVSAIPEGVDTDAVGDMLAVMAERIKENTGSAKLTRDIIFEKALYQASCKAAIKAGRVYPEGYAEWLVRELKANPEVICCPHGRPIAIEITKNTIDHLFKRI
jgi:DNA mismatch repair protein MutL